jgi:hypothetical protein
LIIHQFFPSSHYPVVGWADRDFPAAAAVDWLALLSEPLSVLLSEPLSEPLLEQLLALPWDASSVVRSVAAVDW